MNITRNGEWTRYEGMRWELEDEFPHLTHLLGGSDEPEELQTPDDWCTLEIHSVTDDTTITRHGGTDVHEFCNLVLGEEGPL